MATITGISCEMPEQVAVISYVRLSNPIPYDAHSLQCKWLPQSTQRLREKDTTYA